MENLSAKEGKTVAIISYLTVIGLIVAMIMNRSKYNSFANFHIRQSIGINVFFVLNSWFVPSLLGYRGSALVWLFIAVLWFIGIVGAIKEEEKEVPIVGTYFQQWFNF